MHFVINKPDGSVLQVDQPISRQQHEQFIGYKMDARRVDMIEKVLRKNSEGLCVRRWTATKMVHLKVTEKLYNELVCNANKCGQNLSQHCTVLLSGKQPRAAFTEEELELLRDLKKTRADVQLMFNAMVAEFARLPDAERLRVVINGKSYDWWREYLIRTLEITDKMRDKVLDMAD